MTLASFHPAVSAWFAADLGTPTGPQEQGWTSIGQRRHTLVAAPTGSGKTLAAFLSAIDGLVREGLRDGALPDETRVLYVSPLRALSNDIERNLQRPLRGIGEQLRHAGVAAPEIRTAVRTGDTPAKDRAAATKRPPHIFVTTPESLYILLTSAGGRAMLRTVRTVIVDEIHALVGDKRGSHLSLSLARLDALCREDGGVAPVRVGLSATQTPIEDVARFLVGERDTPCTIVDAGHMRRLDLAVETCATPLSAVISHDAWDEIYERLAGLCEQHDTTLVFVNTRRLAERMVRHLAERLGPDQVAAHHGSLAREVRHDAERRLKNGELRAIVATASLELGIDIGTVDLVCQIGSPRRIATLLQRVGRSGHAVCGLPKGRLFPLSRDDLVEAAALLQSVGRHELDRLCIPTAPLDILAQQIVATCAKHRWAEDDLFALVRGAYPYRDLSRSDFDDVIQMLCEGFATGRGRRAAQLHRDAVNRTVKGRRGAQILALTSGGAIPDLTDYQVILEPEGAIIGSLNEDFAIESMAGDVFQLGNNAWQIAKVEPGRVRVYDAAGKTPTIPFWLGEAPGRSPELSASVSRLRADVDERLGEGLDVEGTTDWVCREVGLDDAAARQLVEYLASAREALGAMPTQDTLVLERFFDESGGMQLVLHAPFGTRLNRAWGLALRKRFCQRFNFELQAAANDDAVVISLGPVHSFPLCDVFEFLSPNTVRPMLTQALLDAPMFMARWRWNATRALAVARFAGGRRVPPQLQRLRADDLLTVSFPDQVACAENLTGAREIPDHPLVQQTIHDCLTEAMDVEALEGLLGQIKAGTRRLWARDLPEPSPMSLEILNVRPFGFLDDAPLEERRTHAVSSRRFVDPKTASDLGALDPEAIARACGEAWPVADDPDELHDALLVLSYLTPAEVVDGHARDGRGWSAMMDSLATQGRATRLRLGDHTVWVAAERLTLLLAAFPEAVADPPIALPPGPAPPDAPEPARAEVLRGRLEGLGPVTAQRLASELGRSEPEIHAALLELEADGTVLRGRFSSEALQWCERGLLARIHRYTLSRLRAAVKPVTAADFVRFCIRWQGLEPGHRRQGTEGLDAVLDQLEGFESPASAWEAEVLPRRLEGYDPGWLDQLCLMGRVSWLRLQPPAARAGFSSASRSTPIGLVRRAHLHRYRTADVKPADPLPRDAATVIAILTERGASFFDDLVVASGLGAAELEGALGDLVGRGRVTADSFHGLRALFGRRPGRPRAMERAGRWSLVPDPQSTDSEAERLEAVARGLLRRWGVVWRPLLRRERNAPPWHALVRVYRRLEARGEIRGGRFVEGQSGEQYAAPEAVGLLRQLRREGPTGTEVVVSAADPLNLVGIVGPGPRVPTATHNRVLYRDGVAVAVRESGRVGFPRQADEADQTRWTAALLGPCRATDRAPGPEPSLAAAPEGW